jgi:hypothetical protein
LFVGLNKDDVLVYGLEQGRLLAKRDHYLDRGAGGQLVLPVVFLFDHK